jgi:sorbitol/mannitol transport system permease protein
MIRPCPCGPGRPLAVGMMPSLLLEVRREVLEAGEVDGASLIISIRTIICPGLSTGAVR